MMYRLFSVKGASVPEGIQCPRCKDDCRACAHPCLFKVVDSRSPMEAAYRGTRQECVDFVASQPINARLLILEGL